MFQKQNIKIKVIYYWSSGLICQLDLLYVVEERCGLFFSTHFRQSLRHEDGSSLVSQSPILLNPHSHPSDSYCSWNLNLSNYFIEPKSYALAIHILEPHLELILQN